jgi:predicted ATPase
MDQFTELALANWRNFKHVRLALAERVFIVGPNAAGKSNLLDAFRFLRDIAADGGGLTNALGARRGIQQRSLPARGEGERRRGLCARYAR